MNFKLLMILISVMAKAFMGEASISPAFKREVRRYLNILWTLVAKLSF